MWHKTRYDLTRYVGIIQLLFFVGHLYMIGVWFGDDQKNKHHKTRVQKRLYNVFRFH